MKLHDIGKYKFRETDFRQITVWAESLQLDPDEVVNRLESATFDSSCPFANCEISLEVSDGSIRSLVLDFDLLPVKQIIWVPGLNIRKLALRGKLSAPVRFNLPMLSSLHVPNLSCDTDAGCLADLDLSGLPQLEELDCSYNCISSLDLFRVPRLRSLWPARLLRTNDSCKDGSRSARSP